ncbi:MAG: NRDE family protein [Chitinophagaceae bacterium]|nr:NRDE family protein [Chitinophagaceae bacterium]
MCTVSFIPCSQGVIITSNRDEKNLRQIALAPQQFSLEHKQLYYPVDVNSDGTWFIVSSNGTVGVLLNGAFTPHIVKEKYSMSRGKILPLIFEQENVVTALQNLNLVGIENFTILIYQHKKLLEFKWNGEQLFIQELNNNIPHIYSSVTLYNSAMIEQRELWFKQWLLQNAQPNQANTIQFHSTAGDGNKEFGLQMNRNNLMLTVSVTSILIKNNEAILFYKDCLQNKETTQTIALNAMAVC